VNNPTLGEFCFTMIGRADIEGSKSDVAKNAWPPQASSLIPYFTQAFPLGIIVFTVTMLVRHFTL
jgi:hypothetical protein